ISQMSCIDLLGRTWAPPVAVPPPAAPAPQAPPGAPAPPPPLTGAPLTVDDAWVIFGIPQKRAPKQLVKSRYLAFVATWHTDKHPEDESGATAQLVRANE